MAKPKKKKEQSQDPGLRPETKRGILAVILFAGAAFLLLSIFGKAGGLGRFAAGELSYLLGHAGIAIPLLLTIVALSLVTSIAKRFSLMRWVGTGILSFSILGLISILSMESGSPSGGNGAGLVGGFISGMLLGALDYAGSAIVLGAATLISLSFIFDLSLHDAFASLGALRTALFARREKEPELKIIGGAEEGSGDEETPADRVPDDEEDGAGRDAVPAPAAPKSAAEEEIEDSEGGGFAALSAAVTLEPWDLPPVGLLELDSGKPGSGDVKANANMIKRTLQNFGIDVEMDEVTIGPSVTRYALKPAEGVKLSRIGALQDNLSYALAAHPIRIEAPIPGKSLVGIEIPNTTKSTVGLGSLLSEEEYQKSDKPLLLALGKSIAAKPHFANLSKMPHMLIAGATGSGKSVTIHALINSLLFRNAPEALKFIMIDPKRVELTLYNGIPHLVSPVVTDPRRAILALRWAASEMDRRYTILEERSVRDVHSYQTNVFAPAIEALRRSGEDPEDAKLPPPMPYIVIVIDELADIMATYPRELEGAIVRLAQMSRAVGIHLILSTQRPSVNVITGLIKANIPARVALQVASQIDSRTILDMSGAENLLGAGDMLFLSPEMSKPVRLQSAFISEREVKDVVAHLKTAGAERIVDQIDFAEAVKGKDAIFDSAAGGGGGDSGEEDVLYEEARELVIREGKASTSLLQRKLGIGYGRAARIIDHLFERGVVGPAAAGSKARDVIGSGIETSTGAETPDERMGDAPGEPLEGDGPAR